MVTLFGNKVIANVISYIGHKQEEGESLIQMAGVPFSCKGEICRHRGTQGGCYVMPAETGMMQRNPRNAKDFPSKHQEPTERHEPDSPFTASRRN